MVRKSILAGVFIGLAGFVNLATGGPVGAFLFSFGLLCIYYYGLMLFTGKAGVLEPTLKGFGSLTSILLFNIVGAAIVGFITKLSTVDITSRALTAINTHLSVGPLKALTLAIPCGLIVDSAVDASRKGNYFLTFIGVPVFVLCGFPHCIADAFYIFASGIEPSLHLVLVYINMILGNYIGCNIRRLLKLS